MPYRITQTDKFGNKGEWNVGWVNIWTQALINQHPELAHPTMFMDILYEGKFKDMYNIIVDENWHKNILEAMKNDRVGLKMEEMEPMCKNKVPREGVVIRINDDKFARAWKLKSKAHYNFEAKENDKGIMNIEDQS